ncbi:winged helix-turn-helix transcriptional regulator [Jiangella alkaliphila]|uniref:DNA-binding transcriptional regulator, HxlR family n=1 Tax=Jiangella alkaliphila TaxID=419479 RepID=A0A1H2LCJ1_9ACTN|nr:helix-turn-helix domain-containing protein [Jiangella alkaliphila]SDU78291.1 DNA-binding transcriptional regulator, HxlR family [Jiangella alkaliphila]
MKSYGQLCAVARALDVVGDRWTLLIVRELLIRRRARFTELQSGLPRIAPNLLTGRLRDLERHGVVLHDTATGAGGVYRLTERGRALEGVVRELLKWGAPTVPYAPADADFQMHWLSMPAAHLLRDSQPDSPPVTVRFGDLADGFDVIAGSGTTDVRPCEFEKLPDAVVTGPGHALVGLIQGAIALRYAADAGVVVTGSRSAVQRLLPVATDSARLT